MSKFNYKKSLAFLASFIMVFILPIFILNAAGGPGGATINNPLGDNNTEVKDILLKVMNIVAMVGGIVVVFMIIYSGFKFVTAGDSDSDRTKAKDIFYATVIGGDILLGADIIANIVVNTVKAIKN